MLHEWKSVGIEIYTADLTSSDTFPLDGEDESAVMYNLCERLLIEYPGHKNAALISRLAMNGKKYINTKYIKSPSSEFDPELVYNSYNYNVVTDG